MTESQHRMPDELRDFVEGRVPAATESAIVEHLNDCTECQHTVTLLAGGDAWAVETREVLRTLEEFEDDPYSAHGNDVTEESDVTEIPRVMLQCLAPTDDPAMLGRLGIYEVFGVVGAGGAGIVFKALERSLNRFVAVKVLSPLLACNGAARKRFAREARAAAAIVHEHVVPIHAVDEFQGLPFLVMQYIPGRSLQQRLNHQGPLGIREILRIGHQAALGLAAAHAQGVVHRDIKPANILLENGVERVLLTDFGLARTVDDASLTCSGVIAGTPEYMSPEQARGETVDHCSDLFSLGSVLYALCTGHSPFRASTTMGILQRICHDAPRPVCHVNPEIPDEIGRYIERLLDKRIQRRPQSATEVATWCADQLSQVQLPSAARRVQERRVRMKWGLAAAGIIALSSVVAGAVWSTRPPSPLANATDLRTPIPEPAQPIDDTPPDATPAARGTPKSNRTTAPDDVQELQVIRQQLERLERETRTPGPSQLDRWDDEIQRLLRSVEQLESDKR